ncbi:MAG: beta-propeller domain-containing protein [Deltaproteobacteria bacterium]|nr:beta-propeller domain-containing protein [Deltaproteobacteria bacterium]
MSKLDINQKAFPSFRKVFLPTATIAVCLFIWSCSKSENKPQSAQCSQWNEPIYDSIKTFSSDVEFQQYLVCVAERLNGEKQKSPAYPAAAASPTLAGSTNTNITNLQESDVDEGGIVKNIGKFLIVLRKGRLYALSIATPGAPLQTDVVPVAAEQSLSKNVWYDEILVRGDKIYVIGFRYAISSDEPLAGAVEISSFRMSDGKLIRGQAVYMESNDYYSVRNYATRMVDGKLVLYMPHYGVLYRNQRYIPNVPHYLSFNGGKFHRTRPILGGNNVFMSLQRVNYPTLHTSVVCSPTDDLALDCKATSVLGSSFRKHYVSKTHMFVWNDKAVYAMDFKSMLVSAHRLEGSPIDQFSFKQEGNFLYILTQNHEADVLKLFRLPLLQFNAYANQDLSLLARDIRTTRHPARTYSVNRFVDGNLLVGTLGEVLVIPLSGAPVSEVELNEQVVRIETLSGIGALVITEGKLNDQPQLNLQVLQVSQSSVAKLLGFSSIPGTQGEWRSHGFFFKPSPGGGVLGLPVVRMQSGVAHWSGTGTANIAFFRADSTRGALTYLSVVASSPTVSGVCETSCTDWYGNTRPIFMDDRVFALMGSELQEVELKNAPYGPVGARLVLR